MSDVDIVDVFKGSSLWLTQAIISSSSSFELFFGVSSISNGEVVTICGSFSVGGPLVLSPMLICGLSGCIWSALGTSSLPGIVSSGLPCGLNVFSRRSFLSLCLLFGWVCDPFVW